MRGQGQHRKLWITTRSYQKTVSAGDVVDGKTMWTGAMHHLDGSYRHRSEGDPERGLWEKMPEGQFSTYPVGLDR